MSDTVSPLPFYPNDVSEPNAATGRDEQPVEDDDVFKECDEGGAW